ncbi:MAG: hypothetical protein AAF713_10400 [Pseudomonadota bacterium]
MPNLELAGNKIAALDFADPVVSGDFGHLNLVFGDKEIEVQAGGGVIFAGMDWTATALGPGTPRR